MTPAPRRRRRRARRVAIALVALALVVAVTGVAAISTDTLGAGHLFDRAVARVDRFLAGPVPDRSAPVTVLVPEASGAAGGEVDDETVDESESTPTPIPTPVPPVGPTTTIHPDPTATPAPPPVRKAVDVDIVKNHKKVFAHEIEVTMCASAGVQMVLAILGHGDTSHGFQREIHRRVREWESKKDSRNGAWGPSAMALALEEYGATGYEVRAYKTRQGALRDAAKSIQRTNSPAILLSWRGAHTWVMTGFRADADPSVFDDATIKGTYILDPWYPDVSSIWGPSDPPGTYQNGAEMVRNYLKWKRPEGRYPDRDGLYIAVVPTEIRAAD